MKDRILGRSGMSVSPLGLGTWSIGGEMYLDGKNDSYGDVNDEESVAAIRTAIDNGVTFFDSADCYGAGHSEKLLGRAIRGKRDDLVIATKFGFVFDQKTKHITGTDYSREYVKRACKGSLKRLGTDYIDLYYIHIWHLEREQALEACEGLEELVEEGYIRYYGWSTDHEECITYLQDRPNFVSIMHNLNVFDNNTMLTDFCERHNLASVNRAPLAMGLLSGKYGKDSVMPKNDVRGNGFEWNRYFTGDRPTPE
ncbi:MAG: aldo/keto reductase, partial [Spirochaetota bacterium]